MKNSKFYLEKLVLKVLLKKTKTALCSTVIRTLCILSLIAMTSSCADKDDSPTISEKDNLETEVFKEINEYRKSKNLDILINSDVIAKIAREHSKNMASGNTEFGHSGFNERCDCISEEINNTIGFAENVAYGYSSAKTVTNGWVNSPGHKRNIEGDYTHTGVGIATAKDGTPYYTQIFIKIEQ